MLKAKNMLGTRRHSSGNGRSGSLTASGRVTFTGTLQQQSKRVEKQKRRQEKMRKEGILDSPWEGRQIRIIKQFVKGFEDFAPKQHALTNLDLMFWAITAGAAATPCPHGRRILISRYSAQHDRCAADRRAALASLSIAAACRFDCAAHVREERVQRAKGSL